MVQTEFYVQGGFSFHSNDGRGTTLTVEPVSADNPYPNTPATPIPRIDSDQRRGNRRAHCGCTTSAKHAFALVSPTALPNCSRMATPEARSPHSSRANAMASNGRTTTRHAEHVAFDFDLANSKALFTAIDEDDAAPDSPGGKRVPEAVGLVIASGITLHDYNGFSSSLRLRYFGPRDLTSDGIYRSQATALLNGEVGYRISEKWRVSAESLNLLNRRDHDIDYAYTSRITRTAAPAFTNVFHPVEPLQVRFWLRRTF